MFKLSRNNQNIIMFGVPPKHSAIGNIQGYFVIGYYYITTCHSKQLPMGLMVLSDGMVPLSEDQEFLKTNLPKLKVALRKFL